MCCNITVAPRSTASFGCFLTERARPAQRSTASAEPSNRRRHHSCNRRANGSTTRKLPKLRVYQCGMYSFVARLQNRCDSEHPTRGGDMHPTFHNSKNDTEAWYIPGAVQPTASAANPGCMPASRHKNPTHSPQNSFREKIRTLASFSPPTPELSLLLKRQQRNSLD